MRSRFPRFVVHKVNTALKEIWLRTTKLQKKGKKHCAMPRKVLAQSKIVVMYFSVCAIYFVFVCMCHVFASSELDSDRS